MKTILHQSLQGRLSMTFSLAQALTILKMPQIELASWLISEIEKNPVLELESLPPSLPLKNLTAIETPPCLYEYLMKQIRERFPNPSEQSKATSLLHHLDERGFLSPPLSNNLEFGFDPIQDQGSSELKTQNPILSILQSFDPPGIFARDLRECLMLQLPHDSPAYKIVNFCFKDLLQGRFETIQKKTGISDLASAIKSLARLNLRPASLFNQEFNPPIIPDLSIAKIGKTWIVESNDEELPKFHLRADYLSLPLSSSDEKQLFRQWIASGKWLLRSLKRRKSILLDIGVFLVRKQAAYLNSQGPLQPLSIKVLAEQVHLHESTLSRALAEKYAQTPSGMIPLRALLSAPSESAKHALQKIIAQEDRNHPLSDNALVDALQKKGVQLSRRTIAKYRKDLKIGPAPRRKFL